MGINSVAEKTNKDGTIRFCGRLYDTRGVIVDLRPRPDCTLMAVKMGPSGDEPLSRILVDRVSLRLAMQPRFPVLPGTEANPAANPNFARDALPDSIQHLGQDVTGYRGTPLR
jgi:hypothetical protein